MGILGYLIAPSVDGTLGQTIGFESLGALAAAVAAVLIALAVFARRRGAALT